MLFFLVEDLEIVNVGGIYDFCENDLFIFGFIVIGGVFLYIFNWSIGDIISVFFIFEFGDYNLIVIDVNGCVVECNFEVFVILVFIVELLLVVM